jgi:hypothetical protein
MTTTTEWIKARLDEIQPELDALQREMAVLAKECDALHTALTALTGATAKTHKKNAKRDYPAIAAWLRQARADGSYSLKGLAEAFDSTVDNAKNWDAACRDRNLDTGRSVRASAA